MRRVCKGEPTAFAMLAAELGVSYNTVLDLHRALQASAEWMQPDTPLTDEQTGTDEMFQIDEKLPVSIVTSNSRLVYPSPHLTARLVAMLAETS